MHLLLKEYLKDMLLLQTQQFYWALALLLHKKLVDLYRSVHISCLMLLWVAYQWYL